MVLIDCIQKLGREIEETIDFLDEKFILKHVFIGRYVYVSLYLSSPLSKKPKNHNFFE